MARILNDGAEMRDTSFFTVTNSNISVTNSAPSAFVPGGYYYKTYYSFGNDGGLKTVDTLYEVYLRARILFTSPISSEVLIFPIFLSGGNVQAALGVSPASKFSFIRGSTLVEESSILAMDDRWYLIEIYYKAHNTTGSFVTYIDGNLCINFTGDTEQYTGTGFNQLMYNARQADVGNLCIDDVAMNDTTGTVDNSWCGEGHITMIYPSGSGTINNFLNSGSVSGSANYLYVSDFPSDGNTSYVYCSGSNVGFKDQYAMSNFNGTGKIITRIWAESTIKKTTSGSGTIKIGYLPNGGTSQLSGSIPIFLDYTRIVGTSASANPLTGVEWTEEDINDLEYVSEIS
jgi:hypothetical protein